MTNGFVCWACGNVVAIVTSFYDSVLRVRGRRCKSCSSKAIGFKPEHVGKETDYERRMREAREPDEYDLALIGE